jgi:hypothetical protein
LIAFIAEHIVGELTCTLMREENLDDAGFSEVRWCLPHANVLACPIGTLRWPIGNSNRPHPLAQLQDRVSPLAGIEPYVAGAG